MSRCHWCNGKGYYTVNAEIVICYRCNMPKLSAGTTQTEEIVRVDIDSATLNDKNEDGTYKFSDDQMRQWLHKLRGDRETTVAKAQTKAAAPSAPGKPKYSAEDMTDE